MNAIAKNVFTIVCDDIREEIGGKTSLMGVYSDIILRSLPVVLPKLSFAFILRGIKRKFSNIDFIVTLPNGNPIKVNTINFQQIETTIKIGGDCNLYMAMAPFHVKSAGKVKLELSFDEAVKPQIVHTFEIKVVPAIKDEQVKQP